MLMQLSVRPKEVEDISHFLCLDTVGDEPQWVGPAGNALYRPLWADTLNPNGPEKFILAREAFVLDRTIKGRGGLVPEARVGQIAILGAANKGIDHDAFSFISSTVIPYKKHGFAPIQYPVLRSDAQEFDAELGAPRTSLYDLLLGNAQEHLRATVQKAIFELINSENSPKNG